MVQGWLQCTGDVGMGGLAEASARCSSVMSAAWLCESTWWSKGEDEGERTGMKGRVSMVCV